MLDHAKSTPALKRKAVPALQKSSSIKSRHDGRPQRVESQCVSRHVYTAGAKRHDITVEHEVQERFVQPPSLPRPAQQHGERTKLVVPMLRHVSTMPFASGGRDEPFVLPQNDRAKIKRQRSSGREDNYLQEGLDNRKYDTRQAYGLPSPSTPTQSRFKDDRHYRRGAVEKLEYQTANQHGYRTPFQDSHTQHQHRDRYQNQALPHHQVYQQIQQRSHLTRNPSFYPSRPQSPSPPDSITISRSLLQHRVPKRPEANPSYRAIHSSYPTNPSIIYTTPTRTSHSEASTNTSSSSSTSSASTFATRSTQRKLKSVKALFEEYGVEVPPILMVDDARKLPRTRILEPIPLRACVVPGWLGW